MVHQLNDSNINNNNEIEMKFQSTSEYQTGSLFGQFTFVQFVDMKMTKLQTSQFPMQVKPN